MQLNSGGGKKLELLLNAAFAQIERGERLSPKTQRLVDDSERITEIELPYWGAWNALRRHTGVQQAGTLVVPAPIDYVNLSMWAKDHGFFYTVEMFEEFEYLVMSLDEYFVEWNTNKAVARAESASKATTRPR